MKEGNPTSNHIIANIERVNLYNNAKRILLFSYAMSLPRSRSFNIEQAERER